MLVFKPVLSRKIKLFFTCSLLLLLTAESSQNAFRFPGERFTVVKSFDNLTLEGKHKVSQYNFLLNPLFFDYITPAVAAKIQVGQPNVESLIQIPATYGDYQDTKYSKKSNKKDESSTSHLLTPSLLRLPTSFDSHPLKTYELALYAQIHLQDFAEPLDLQYINDAAMDSLGLHTDKSVPIKAKYSIQDLKYHQKLLNYADQYQIPHSIFVALIDQESSFKTTAKSSANAIGLGQIMPETALWLTTGRAGPFEPQEIQSMEKRLMDPDFNLKLSARFFAYLMHENLSDLDLALASYNAGLGSVRRHGGVPPFPQTINYVAAVKAKSLAYFKLLAKNINNKMEISHNALTDGFPSRTLSERTPSKDNGEIL